MELTVIVRQEREDFWAEVNELPGCFASARTLSELSEALAEAIGLYLWDLPAELGEAQLELGESRIQAIPAPIQGRPA